MSQMNKYGLKAMLLTLTLMLISCGGSTKKSDDVVLRLGHSLDVQHSVHKAMVFLGERLTEYSNGQMTVKIYAGGQLGTEREMLELLQIGSLAMTTVLSLIHIPEPTSPY